MADSLIPPDAADSFDGPWKVALVTYFSEFLELCFPDLSAAMDASYPPEFLDTELEQIMPVDGRGSLGVDKLVRLRLKDGDIIRVLVHIEVQAQFAADFPERMWGYHYRIYDKFREHPLQLAVLADNHPHWKPDHYASAQSTARLSLTWPVFKVLDLKNPKQIFARTGNVFALILAANVAVHQTKGDGLTRMKKLLGLVRAMKEQGLAMTRIFDALRVLEWLLKLPRALHLQFRAERSKILEEEVNMKLKDLLLIEEIIAKEEGQLEGELKKAREFVLEVLEVRFGEIPYIVAERIRHLESVEALKQLHRRAITVESLQAFENEIPAAG